LRIGPETADGNISNAARIARVPERTLNSWVRKYQEWRSPAPRDADEVPAAREKARVQLADRYEELAQRCLDEVTDAKLASATVRELILGSAIAVDKCDSYASNPPPGPRRDFDERSYEARSTGNREDGWRPATR
jgi:transposase-like protein